TAPAARPRGRVRRARESNHSGLAEFREPASSPSDPPNLLVPSRSPFGDGADSEILWRLAKCVHSGALHACAANPGDHRPIHVAHAREANPEAHCVVTVRPQAAPAVLPVEPQPA